MQDSKELWVIECLAFLVFPPLNVSKVLNNCDDPESTLEEYLWSTIKWSAIRRGMPVPDYVYVIVMSILYTGSVPWWLWRSKLPCCELPMKPSSRELRSALSLYPVRNVALTFVALEELSAANNHMSSETDPAPLKPQMKPQPQWHLDWNLANDPAKPFLLTHWNCEMKSMCCFKLLTLWYYSYTVVDDNTGNVQKFLLLYVSTNI